MEEATSKLLDFVERNGCASHVRINFKAFYCSRLIIPAREKDEEKS
jgi:hypothetical protein